jgi:hypothetical protein
VRIVAGLLCGLAGAGLWGTFLALLAGRLTAWASGLALIVGAGAVVLASRRVAPLSLERPGRWDVLALVLLGLACLRQFAALLYEKDGQVFTLSPYNYGDLPLHWTYVQNLAAGAPFWPENPIFTGARLHYPLGVDLVTAMLVQLGVPLAVAFTGLGLACSGLLAYALFAWARGFGVAGFLFAGGLAGLEVLQTGVLRDAQQGLAWKSLFLALWLPQRGFLFALPAGLLLLWSFRERLVRGREGGLAPAVEGVLWGALPLFHVHTFLFVSVVVGLWALATRRVKDALPSLAVAFLPACFGAWLVTGGFSMGSVIWWKPGWVMGAQNPLVFLAVNFGLFLPLAVAAAVLSVRGRDHEARLLLLPGLGLFTLLFFVMFAPWDWDNTKLLLWCYVLLLAPVGALVRRMTMPARVPVVALLFASGAVCVAAASRGKDAVSIAVVDELREVCAGLSGIAATERIATAQSFNHPAALCGHPIVAGYSGHLWSHGIVAGPVEADLAALMNGAPDWPERAQRLKARYVFWGTRERAAFPASSRPWAEQAVVARGRWGTVYSAAP